jgi:hypothetical protein
VEQWWLMRPVCRVRRQESRCGAGLLPTAGLGVQPTSSKVAVSHELAHAEFLGQCQGLLVVRFGLLDIRGIGVGMDNATLVQHKRLGPTLLELPGQVERLARVLPGLLAAFRQPTDLTEPCDPVGMTLQRACADIFPDRLLSCVGWLLVAPSVAFEQNAIQHDRLCHQ